METWHCSFCGKHEDQGMVHTTCIISNVHYYFCPGCWNQWEGFEELTNINIIKLKSRVREQRSMEKCQ